MSLISVHSHADLAPAEVSAYYAARAPGIGCRLADYPFPKELLMASSAHGQESTDQGILAGHRIRP